MKAFVPTLLVVAPTVHSCTPTRRTTITYGTRTHTEPQAAGAPNNPSAAAARRGAHSGAPRRGSRGGGCMVAACDGLSAAAATAAAAASEAAAAAATDSAGTMMQLQPSQPWVVLTHLLVPHMPHMGAHSSDVAAAGGSSRTALQQH